MNANAILAKTGLSPIEQRLSNANPSQSIIRKNQFLKTEDAGGYAVSQKLGSHKKIEKEPIHKPAEHDFVYSDSGRGFENATGL